VDIGIFGLWGMNVPGRHFGGFETIYCELAARLVQLGCHVTVYSRRECYPECNQPGRYNGVRIVYVTTLCSGKSQ